VERQSLKRTKLDHEKVAGCEPCITCGKPVTVVQYGGPFSKTAEDGIGGTLWGGKQNPRYKFYICDDCLSDLVDRARVVEDREMYTGSLSFAPGSGELKTYPIKDFSCDIVGFDKEYSSTFKLFGTGLANEETHH